MCLSAELSDACGPVGASLRLTWPARIHAGLAAYEEGEGAVLSDRRMDFAHRDRDQASLPGSGKLGPDWLFRL
jgi:hypothetical protein